MSPTTQARGFVHTAPSHGDDDFEIGRKHGLEMTYNILDDSSYRADLPFFGGERIIKENGKPGNANKVVIDKLVEVGKLLARRRITISDAHSWRFQGAGHPPQPPAMVRGHRQALGRRPRPIRRDDPHPRPDLHRPTGRLDAQDRPQPSLQHDRGAAGLGPVAPARMGRAVDLFSSRKGRHRQTPISCCATRRSTPASSRPSRPRARMRGTSPAPRRASSGTSTTPRRGNRSSTSSTSGSIVAQPTPSSCATARTGPRTASRTSTSRAPTSTGGGSIPRCCRPAAPSGARPTGAF